MSSRDHRFHAVGATAVALLLGGGAAALAGCGSSEDVGGCWGATDGDRTVSFFVDTDDDGSVVGLETLEGERPVQTEFEGRWEDTGGGGHRIDASCTRREPGGCDGVASWSLRCTLVDAETLTCAGSPFAAETTLSPCQGTATVPGGPGVGS